MIAWNRFAGIVSSATPVGTAGCYRELVNHFQLPWEDKMEKALDSWKSKRSPLAHGPTRQEGNLEDLFHASRMAGAMNVLSEPRLATPA